MPWISLRKVFDLGVLTFYKDRMTGDLFAKVGRHGTIRRVTRKGPVEKPAGNIGAKDGKAS